MAFPIPHSLTTGKYNVVSRPWRIECHCSPGTIFRYPSSTESLSHSFSLFPHHFLSPPSRRCTLYGRLHSHSHPNSSTSKTHFVLEILLLSTFSLSLLFLRLASNVFLPDLPRRWTQLVAFAEDADAQFSKYPSHLWQSVVAAEDRRFFRHFGVDPVGVARAIVWFSSRGGGSTITQQLVRNMFLRNERTFTRKVVEMALALALERMLSKTKILCCYLRKIYWGHGIYGIDSASKFYFGKHSSLLSLGECAMLVGIIPSPEFRSPFRDSMRAKRYQARVLKRMVEVGFLDSEKAILVLRQSLVLNAKLPDNVDGLLPPRSSSGKKKGKVDLEEREIMNIWEWERESKIWEVIEDMEAWCATKIKKKMEKRKFQFNSQT